MNPYLFDPPAQKRRELFIQNGWGEPPYAPDERYNLAVKMMKDQQAEKALALHDPIVDCQDWKFSELAANLYEDMDALYCDLDKALKYYQRAFEIADGADDYRNAWYYLRAYFKANNIEEEDLPFLYKDKFVFRCILATIMQKWDLPYPTDWKKEGDFNPKELYGAYLLACFVGAGNGTDQDHKQAVEIYTAYINEIDSGLLGATYTNLSLRHALGLGVDANIDEAIKLEILSQKIDHADFEGISLELIDTYDTIAKGMKNPTYRTRYQALVKQTNESTNNPWEIFNQTTENHEYSSIEQQAFIDFLLLTNLLSKREGWSNNKYWNAVYRQALVNYRSLDDVIPIVTQNFDPFIYATFDEDIRKGNKGKFELTKNELYEFKLHFNFYKQIRDYYLEHGLDNFPYKPEDRLETIHHCLAENPPRLHHAYVLFNEDIDSENAEILERIAFVLSNFENSDLFDPEYAEELYLKAIELGHPDAAFALGIKYRFGHETDIDLDKALGFFKKATDLGHNNAKYQILNLLKLKHEIEELDNEDFYSDEITRVYKDAFTSGEALSNLYWARLLIHRARKNGDELEDIIDIYEPLAFYGPEKDMDKRISSREEEQKSRSSINYQGNKTQYFTMEQAKAAYALSARLALGLDTPINPLRSLTARLKTRLIIKDHQASLSKGILFEPITNFARQFFGKELKASYRLVKELYDYPERFPTVIEGIDYGVISPNKKLKNAVEIIAKLAEIEEWSNTHDWHALAEAIEAKRYGLTFRAVTESSLNSGPRYTPLDSRGMPILGVYSPPSVNLGTVQQSKVNGQSYVPNTGIINLKGIRADQKGFHYDTDTSLTMPAMILPEDISVTQMLVFGHPEFSITPSLSLENHGYKEKPKEQRQHVATKAWDPEWLGHTDFGRTLFITDHLIGNWAWNCQSYRVGPSTETESPEMHELGKEFIRDIRLTGGRKSKGDAMRVMLKPETVYITPPADQQASTARQFQVAVKEIRMRVDGDYMTMVKGGQPIHSSLNDTRYEQGRICQKLTDRYNDLAQLDPRFERAKQLMALYYATLRLKEIGYRPPDHIQEKLSEGLLHCINLGDVPKSDRLDRRHYMKTPIHGIK